MLGHLSCSRAGNHDYWLCAFNLRRRDRQLNADIFKAVSKESLAPGDSPI